MHAISLYLPRLPMPRVQYDEFVDYYNKFVVRRTHAISTCTCVSLPSHSSMRLFCNRCCCRVLVTQVGHRRMFEETYELGQQIGRGKRMHKILQARTYDDVASLVMTWHPSLV